MVRVKAESTWVPIPKVSQQNIAWSITLPLQVRLLPIVQPAACKCCTHTEAVHVKWMIYGIKRPSTNAPRSSSDAEVPTISVDTPTSLQLHSSVCCKLWSSVGSDSFLSKFSAMCAADHTGQLSLYHLHKWACGAHDHVTGSPVAYQERPFQSLTLHPSQMSELLRSLCFSCFQPIILKNRLFTWCTMNRSHCKKRIDVVFCTCQWTCQFECCGWSVFVTINVLILENLLRVMSYQIVVHTFKDT